MLECDPYRHYDEPPADEPSTTVEPDSNNDTVLRFHHHKHDEDNGKNNSPKQTAKDADSNKNSSKSTPTDSLPSHSITSHNMTKVDKPEKMHGTGNITNIPTFGPSARGACPFINRLQRLESANSDFYTTFTLNPFTVEEYMLLSDGVVGLIRFDLLPVKDITGTLKIKTKVKEMVSK